MFNGELIIANENNLACTNSAVFSVTQKLSTDRKSMSRTCFIEAQKLFVYDGSFADGDRVEGILRLEVDDKQDTKYFTGILLSLNMGLAKIRLDGELKDDNIEQFLKQIERYEFIR